MELRRQFDLPEEDREYLTANYPNWEAVKDGGRQTVLIHDFPLPVGFTADSSTAAIVIPSEYHRVGLDMVFFFPSLYRRDEQVIPATSGSLLIDGHSYQQWSRHYDWVPDENDLTTHLMSVHFWLEDAVKGWVAA